MRFFGFLRALCLAIAGSLFLAGCLSSAEDKVYTIFKCGKAATLLGREADVHAVLRNGRAQLGDFRAPGSQARYAMLLGQRFQEDVSLYQYPPSVQMQMLLALHGSRACQALYR